MAPDEAEMVATGRLPARDRGSGRQGMVINHKRVPHIMREDNLLAIRYRKYILTTNSQHDCQMYLNLAARLTVTAVNQLWVADITYIRLRTEFV